MGCQQVSNKQEEKAPTVRVPKKVLITLTKPQTGDQSIKMSVDNTTDTWEKTFNIESNLQEIIDSFNADTKNAHLKEREINWFVNGAPWDPTQTILSLFPPEVLTSNASSPYSIDISIEISKSLISEDYLGNVAKDKLYGKPIVGKKDQNGNKVFEVFMINKDTKTFKIVPYSQEEVAGKELGNITSSSAFCAGKNNWFISGGDVQGKPSRNFWVINLESAEVRKVDEGLLTPKANHSMIYLPDDLVCIVGGNAWDAWDVTHYSIAKTEFKRYRHDLNRKRITPALCLVNNTFWYVFSNINNESDQDFSPTFERCNCVTKGCFEWITPKTPIGYDFNQKFFGVSHLPDPTKVIFLGGMCATTPEEGINFEYSTETNEITKSNVPFMETHLAGRTFVPWSEKCSFILGEFTTIYESSIVVFNPSRASWRKIFLKIKPQNRHLPEGSPMGESNAIPTNSLLSSTIGSKMENSENNLTMKSNLKKSRKKKLRISLNSEQWLSDNCGVGDMKYGNN